MLRSSPRLYVLFGIASVCATLSAPLAASPEKAARFYEDALGRYARADYAGAVLQLKNALQQDDHLLTAQVLLGRALLAEGDSAGAEIALRKALDLGVDRAEITVYLAKALHGQGKYAELLKLETPSTLTSTARIELLVLRGAASGEQGDNRAAMRFFDEARALDPKSLTVLLADAAQQLRQGNLPRADALAQQALAGDAKNGDAWAIRAAVYAAQRQLGPAAEAYAKTLALNPQHVDARLGRASVLVDLNRDADAENELKALTHYAPQDPRAAYLRGVLAARRDDSAGVAREMGEVVKIVDTIPPEIRNHRANILLLGAMAHYSLRDFQKARSDFEGLLRLQPNNPGANRLVSSIYLMEGDAPRAAGLLESYLRKAPSDTQAVSLLASAYLAQKRYAQAAALLQQIVGNGAGADPKLQTALGASLAGQGDTQLALSHLRAAFEHSDGSSTSGTALAVLLMQRGDAKGAGAVMDKVVAREPHNLIAFNLLGLARAQAGDTEGARAAYGKALAMDARFVPARLNLARLEFGAGQLDAARKRLSDILHDQPNNADALMDLAAIDQQQGRIEAARSGMEKALAVARRNPRPALALVDLWLEQGEAGKAMTAARAAIAAMPDNVNVNIALARAQLASGDAAHARETLTAARKLAGYDVATLIAIARLEIQAQHLEGAQYSVEKALSTQPEAFPALVLQAELALLAKDFASAQRLGKALTEKFPTRAIGTQILGDVALAQGQKASALALHRAAFAKETNTDNALRVLRAHLAAGEATKGLAILRDYAATQPKDARLLGALAEGQMQAGDWKGAHASLGSLIQQSGPDALLLNNLALVMLQENDPQAASTAERAWKLAPGNPLLVDTLGWVLVRQGQADRGLGLLREARLRQPRNPEIRYHLAWALSQAKRNAEAREELAPALTDNGRFDSQDAARQLGKTLGL